MLEMGEAAAFSEYLAGLPPEAGARRVPMADGVALVCPPGRPIFNSIFGLGLTRPLRETELDEVLDLYRRAGIEEYEFALAPLAQPAEALPGWLEARGLRLSSRRAKMYRRPGPVAPIATDLRVEVVGPRHATAFARVIIEAFGSSEVMMPAFEACTGRPDWRCYAAFDGDALVATGQLFVRDGVGWLGAGATLPTHRRRGAQGAIMAARVSAATDLGCRWIITETGEDRPEEPNPSYHNMLRTGFQLAYHRPVWGPG